MIDYINDPVVRRRLVFATALLAVAFVLSHASNVPAQSTVTTNGGTIGKIPKWTTTTLQGDSVISESAAGNIGIGTTSPGAKLDVVGGIYNSGIRITSSSVSGSGLTINKTDTGGHEFNILATASNIAGGAGGLHIFDATANALRMRISPDGNIGIGTTAPAALLTLQKDQATGTEIRVANNNTAGFAGLYLNSGFTQASGGVVQWNNIPGFRNLFVATGGADPLYLGTENSIRLTVQPTSGNVGIGTTGPGYKLDVQNGQINAAGGLCIAGDCKTAWSQVGGGGTSQWITNGNNISNANTGSVGIGTPNPAANLHISGVNPRIRLDGDVNSYYPAIEFYGLAGAKIGTFLGYAGGSMIYDFDSHRFRDKAGSEERMFIDSSGKVGIGTLMPTTKLHVVGDAKVTGNLTVDGNIAAKYQDVAEWVPASELIPIGTVVVLDSTKSNHVIASTQTYDTRVAGVISEKPGLVLGESGDNKVLVATTGRVRVKVDASRGPIRIGDLLVTSDISGMAMKSEPVNIGGVQIHRPGTLIGKALEPLAKGQGEILVLLSLQ